MSHGTGLRVCYLACCGGHEGEFHAATTAILSHHHKEVGQPDACHAAIHLAAFGDAAGARDLFHAARAQVDGVDVAIGLGQVGVTRKAQGGVYLGVADTPQKQVRTSPVTTHAQHNDLLLTRVRCTSACQSRLPPSASPV